MRTTALALAASLLLLFSGSACYAGTGTGSYGGNYGTGRGCELESVLGNAQGVGTGSSLPYLDAYTNPTTVSSLSFDTATVTAGGPAAGPGGGWTTVLSPLDPCVSTQVAILYSSVPGATSASPFQPRITTIDLLSGAKTSMTVATDTTNTSNQGHDQPGWVFDLPGACGAIGYGAENTSLTPPTAWQNSNWGASHNGAQPFKLGCNPSAWANAANEYFLPGVGISEPSLAYNYVGIGNVELVCGQLQGNTNISVSGYPGCYTSRTVSATDVNFDVAGGTCGSYASMIDTTATTGAGWGNCNGLMQLTQAPFTGGFYHFLITAGATLAGGTVTVNCPVSGQAQTVVAFNDSAATVASKIAAQMTTSCDSTNYIYEAGNNSSGCNTSSVCVEIQDNQRKFSALTAPQANNVTTGAGGTGVTANPNVADYTASGYRHFIWGGPTFIPQMFGYVYYGDVQDNALSYRRSGYNNNNAYAMFLLWSPGPDSTGHWTWYDISGNNGSTMGPNNASTTLALIGNGGGGASGGTNADPTEPDMPTIGVNGFCAVKCNITQGQSPYLVRPPASYATNVLPMCYNWSFAGQDACTSNNTNVPIVSQETITYYNGKIYIAFPQYNPGLGQVTGVSVFEINPTTKVTTNNWYISVGSATLGTQWVATLQFITPPNGPLTLYVFSGYAGKTSVCSGSGTCGMKSSFNGTSWSAPTVVFNGLGTGNSSATACSANTDVAHFALLAFCYQGPNTYTGTSNNPVNFYYFKN